ncbi:hypothetical protein ACQPYA_12275 [Micromonospora sp. CA-263727]|uniref:hypothetical protein n=1 Tax=Micromonospora sp. CA-263727 TaxID=3239967 RepID=UPI003D8C5B34
MLLLWLATAAGCAHTKQRPQADGPHTNVTLPPTPDVAPGVTSVVTAADSPVQVLHRRGESLAGGYTVELCRATIAELDAAFEQRVIRAADTIGDPLLSELVVNEISALARLRGCSPDASTEQLRRIDDLLERRLAQLGAGR